MRSTGAYAAVVRLACFLSLTVALGCGADEPATSTGGGGTITGTGGEGALGAGGGGVSSSGGFGGDGVAGGGGNGGAGGVMTDADSDGIADALESQWARDFFPFLALHPDDGCTLHGVLYRLSPHPEDGGLIMIWYDVLYEIDCGLNGHVGDNEVFSALVDPQLGVLALRAISHQGTLCEVTTTCGDLPGCDPCRIEQGRPVIFASKDKHGGYVDEGRCDLSVICDFGGCEAATPSDPPMVNAGEPGRAARQQPHQPGLHQRRERLVGAGAHEFRSLERRRFRQRRQRRRRPSGSLVRHRAGGLRAIGCAR